MQAFYDTHAHLDYPDFQRDLPEVIERARLAGISKIISIGTDFESSRRAIALAERFENVFAVAGWHPTHVTAAPDDLRAELRALAAHPKVVALGETGLDYYRLPSRGSDPGNAEDARYKQKQARIFEQHLEVASETGLNCVIHERSAIADTLEVTERFASKIRFVFHCFSGSVESLQRILQMGSFVSFTGIVTFKNSQNVRDAVNSAPLGSFTLETDCPFLAPLPYRGKRCEPAYVKEISESVAKVKGCTLEELSAETCSLAERFFPKMVAR